MSFFGVLPFSGLIMTKFADFTGLRVAMGVAALIFGVVAALFIYRHHCACARQPAVPEPVVSAAG
jgi:hypothetical protein